MGKLKTEMLAFFQRAMKRSLVNRGIVLMIDLAICLSGFIISVWIQYHSPLFAFHLENIAFICLLFTIYNFLNFYWLKTFRGLIRHTNFGESWRVFLSLTISCIALFITLLIFGFYRGISAFLTINTFMLSLFMMLIFRFVTVSVYNYIKRHSVKSRSKALVYEIEPRSLALTNWINRSSRSSHSIEGFITRDPNARNTRIFEKPVFYLSNDNIYRVFSKYEISTIIFPDYRSIRIEQDFISTFIDMGMSILVAPPLEGIDVKTNIRFQMKPIQFEDLLEREEIKIDMKRIYDQTHDKTILITGAAGSIGSELIRQLSCFKPRLLILFDSGETPLHNLKLELDNDYPDLKYITIIGDVRDSQRIEYVFSNYHPEIIFHSAAYKQVPLMEENPCEAVRVNIMGTKILCDMAVRNNVESFIMISTDKAIKPTSVMGATKRIAEIYVQSYAKKVEITGNPIRIITTRFGNVLGSNGSVIPRFREQIENGGPVTVTDPDIIRYFMTINEACRLILEASSIGNNGEIYFFDMGKPVRIADLAKKMIILAGYKPDVDIKIEYTGLRPGEELFEELNYNEEPSLRTTHEKINIVQVKQYDYDVVYNVIDKVIRYATEVDIDNTVREMKFLLGDFKSQNSPFRKLDCLAEKK
jgi:FlaA1/EpsC-like NDP-sugar epimerase